MHRQATDSLPHYLRSRACPWCALAPVPGQLELFDGTQFGDPRAAYELVDMGLILVDDGADWTAVATSACGRFGFCRERVPAVFGGRRGIGPLIVMPDTNILISIREE